MANQEKLSFCRQCMGHCGVVVEVDEQEQLVAIRGDHEDPQTLGYACFKGLKSTEAHNSPDRILHPLKRMPDGSFEAISIDQALDEIAEKITTILDQDGPEAIAGYKGGGGFFTSSSVRMLNSFLAAIESPKSFSSVTIDQSAKAVAMGRIGIWPAGRTPFHRGDVFMIVGGNPLVSVSTNGFDTRNPQKRLKQAKANGLKLIVIDPRRTETAHFADVFLQPLPGEDCSILAGLIRIILEQGWEDREFCERYAADLDLLRKAVAGFTPELVAERAGVTEAELWEVAEVFAGQNKTGAATSATGPDMSPHGNLAEHLVEALNVICGRFPREGDPVDHPGAIGARYPRLAEVIPAPRWWEGGYRSRIGDYGLLDGELPTATLPDEILEPGPGRVRCLIVHGGNPASAIPDQAKVVRALEAVELLVTIEPFMTMTARLSDYILPPTLQYERADLPLFIYENLLSPIPYTRYTEAVAKPPAGAAVCDDHFYFWALAKRLGLKLVHFEEALDMDEAPTTDQLLAIAARHSPVPFDEIKAAERGLIVGSEDVFVEAGDPESPHRFQLLPDDVSRELEDVARGRSDDSRFKYRLAVRRLRDGLNSAGLGLASIKKRLPFNPVYMNPEDMADEAFSDGDRLCVSSPSGEVEAIAESDPTLRRGVITIVHGFGELPARAEGAGKRQGDASDAPHVPRGVSVNLLLSLDRDQETINAMPSMSGIAVGVSRAAGNH